MYLLKSKADVPLVIIQFSELIKTQFNTQVKCFRSDNAKEFFTSEINNYMNDRGITHESSCVGTPQQNGLVERRLGHLLSFARALILQSNMPNYFWSDAVCTTSHLINWTPARTINYQAPIDIMSEFFPGVKPRTRLPARVFGCVAFVHTQSNKLDP